MSRLIKFRGKDINTGEWVYGGYLKHLKRTLSPIGDSIKDDDWQSLIITSGFSDWNMPKPLIYFEVSEETVGQYTGMKDKHNREVYDGDIVKFKNPFGELTGVVRYYAGCKPIIESKDRKSIDLAECHSEDLEIIKNKFDNI